MEIDLCKLVPSEILIGAHVKLLSDLEQLLKDITKIESDQVQSMLPRILRELDRIPVATTALRELARTGE